MTQRKQPGVALYRQVLETRARDAERAPPALFGIGQCFFTQGDLARAEAAHGKALELRRRVLPAGHEEVAECLLGLASVRTRGSPWRSTSSAACASTRGASPMRSRCSRRRSLSHGRRCPTGTPTSRRCSATCWSAGCAERDALALCREADTIDDAVVAALLALGPRAVQVELGERAQRDVDVTLSLALKCFAGDAAVAGEVVDLVLRRKAITFEASTAQRHALRTGRLPELRARLDELAAVRREHAQAALDGAAERARELERRRDALEAELGRRVPELGLELRLRVADRRALAAALPAGGVLVEYVSFRPRAFGAVTSRSEPTG